MKLTALLYFVLSLFGLDIGGSHFVHHLVADGTEMLYSRATAEAGVARFECVRSVSGRCHYTVFAHECAAASTGCDSEPVERFAVVGGDSRQIVGLHDFSLCVRTDGALPGPDCRMPTPTAAP